MAECLLACGSKHQHWYEDGLTTTQNFSLHANMVGGCIVLRAVPTIHLVSTHLELIEWTLMRHHDHLRQIYMLPTQNPSNEIHRCSRSSLSDRGQFARMRGTCAGCCHRQHCCLDRFYNSIWHDSTCKARGWKQVDLRKTISLRNVSMLMLLMFRTLMPDWLVLAMITEFLI